MVTFPQFQPNGGGIGNALAQGLQMSMAVDEMRDKREQRRRKDEAQQFLEPALAGDQGAFVKLAAADHQSANAVGMMLSRLDARKQAALKDAADFTTQMGMGILNAPPDQQGAAYIAALTEAKRRGMDTSSWPQQWGPQAQGWVQFNVHKAVPVKEWFDKQGSQLVPLGGSGSPAGGGSPATPPPNRDQFVSMMMPHAMEVSKATGLDPRLVIAQSALETGYGTAAPGNNYFGIKSHGMPGGQTLATNEAGPGGGMVPTQASFRTYANPGDSARDYGEFLKTNSRYQPVLGAQGLDAQIEAMGKSGYATDPQYGAKLRQIAQTIQLPGGQQFAMGTPPPSLVAQGANAAPMPQPPPGMAIAGNPAEMPQPPMGGAAPPNAGGQGDSTMPGGGQSPAAAQQQARDVLSFLPPGAKPLGDARTRLPKIENGYMAVEYPNGVRGWVQLPKKDSAQAGGGPFGGTSVEAQALNMLIANGTLTQQQAAELAAGKTITNPADGSVMFMTPSGIFQRPAGSSPTPGAQPLPAGQPAPASAPSGNIPITPPKPVQMTEGQANAALYADRIRAADKIIAQTQDAGLELQGKALEAVPFGLGNYAQSGDYQKLDQARRDFINAVLRRESGAVISPDEFENARRQYFPQPGDKPDTLKQKAENRRIALEGITRAAGPTYKPAQTAPQEGPADKSKRQFDLKKKYGLE